MRKGLYANIHAKRKRGEKMRKKGAKGAPTAKQFARAKQTARKKSQSCYLFRWRLANTEVTGIAWPSAEDNPDRKGADVTAYIKIYS